MAACAVCADLCQPEKPLRRGLASANLITAIIGMVLKLHLVLGGAREGAAAGAATGIKPQRPELDLEAETGH